MDIFIGTSVNHTTQSLCLWNCMCRHRNLLLPTAQLPRIMKMKEPLRHNTKRIYTRKRTVLLSSHFIWYFFLWCIASYMGPLKADWIGWYDLPLLVPIFIYLKNPCGQNVSSLRRNLVSQWTFITYFKNINELAWAFKVSISLPKTQIGRYTSAYVCVHTQRLSCTSCQVQLGTYTNTNSY